MAANVLVDASFLIAFLNRRDPHHQWAVSEAAKSPPAWKTCETALSETFHVLGTRGGAQLIELLESRAVVCTFRLDENLTEVLGLFRKYADVPMSLTDACLVRMTEMLVDPILLTTDADFRIYRRSNRQIVPHMSPREA